MNAVKMQESVLCLCLMKDVSYVSTDVTCQWQTGTFYPPNKSDVSLSVTHTSTAHELNSCSLLL